MSATEYVVLVDQANRATGFAEKMAAHENNLLHRAFSVFIFRKQSGQLELLLQQRAAEKYHCPQLWTNTCCSHPRAAEPITLAGERRLQEELGFSTTLSDIGWFHYNAHFHNGLSENELDHVLVGYIDSQLVFTPNAHEVAACRWINLTDLEKEMGQSPQAFTPWLKPALALVKTYLNTL